MDRTTTRINPLSRRGFLKGAALGAGALSLDIRWALAQSLVTGKPPKTAADIQGKGVPKGIVKLDNNENPLGASPLAIQAVSEHLFEMNRYGVGRSPLPTLLAKMHGIPQGDMNIDFENMTMASLRKLFDQSRIMVDAGSGSLLVKIGIIAIGDGTGEVIEAVNGYGSVSRMVESFKETGAQTNAIRVPLTSDYKHDLEAMSKAITPKTTCVVITNPNNPTGTLVSHGDLVKFVDAVPPTVMVFIDEAYIHFAREPNYQDAIDLALSRDNVIVTRTFSKIYGLAGIRIGYAIASGKILKKIRMYTDMMGSTSRLTEVATTAALGDTDFVSRTKKVIADGRDYLYKEFDAMGLSYIPSHANFVLVDLKKNPGPVVGALRKRQVFVSQRWDNLPTFIRVSIGTPEELEVFVAALKEVMA